MCFQRFTKIICDVSHALKLEQAKRITELEKENTACKREPASRNQWQGFVGKGT